MESTLSEEATRQLAELAIDIVEKIGKKAFDVFKHETTKASNVFYSASSQFIRKYEERHCKIKVLGMREPIDLSTIFTSVRLLDDVSSARFASVEQLEKALRESGDRLLNPKAIASRPGIQVANREQFLLVLGAPGAGKSTYLKKIGLEALRAKHKNDTDPANNYLHSCIPVYVELKRFTSKTSSLEELITQEFSIAGFPEAESFTKTALRKGKLLILLDGLDEIATDTFSRASDIIEDFVDTHGKNRMILSCRLAAYKGGFRRFRNIEMASFDDDQIKEFIFKWFNSELDIASNTAQRCWETICSPEYNATRELAQTPLLLTLLCLVYHYEQDFPLNRTILYREAFNVLLKEWAAEKRIQRDPIYKDLTFPLEEMMLSEIAYEKFKANRLFFTEEELLEFITDFMSSNLNAPRHLDAPFILDAIALQQGIFVERARSIYSFSHLTFQEYLTAKYIDDNSIVDEIISSHLLEARWREVILLIAGLMRKGSDNLLVQINIAARKIAESNRNVSLLIQWSQQTATQSSINESPANRLACILLAIVFGIDEHKDLKMIFTNIIWIIREFDDKLARIIGGAYLEDRALERDLNQKLAREAFHYLEDTGVAGSVHPMIAAMEASPRSLSGTFKKAFNYPVELHRWTADDIHGLFLYVDAILFLIQCRKAALKVSRDTWTKISIDLVRVAG